MATKFRNTETYTPPYLGIIPTKQQIFLVLPIGTSTANSIRKNLCAH